MKWNASYTILVACYIVSFVWVLNNSSLPSLLPLIKDEFKLTYFQTGLVSTASMVAYCGIQFPIGLLSDKFGKKKIILVGTFWVATTLILSGLSKTYEQFLVCLVVIGLGNGMHFIPVSTLIAEIFTKDKGKALSISGSSMAVSRAITPLFALPIALAIGWRNLFYLFSFCGFIAGATFSKLVGELKPLKNSISTTTKKNDKKLYLRPELLKISLIAHLMGYVIILNSFLPLFLIQKYGMSIQNAAYLSIIPPLTWAAGAPVLGIAVDKLGRKKSILFSAMIFSIFSFLLVIINNSFLLIIILTGIGLSNGLSNPAILAYSAEIAREGTRTAEMGLINTFWVLSSVIGPIFSGLIADSAGLDVSFLAFAFLPIIAIILVSIFLKK